MARRLVRDHLHRTALLVVVLLGIATGLVVASGAAAALLSTEFIQAANGWGTVKTSLTAHCRTDGISVVNFNSSAEPNVPTNTGASGPYPGSFTIRGSVTLGPQTNPPTYATNGFASGPVQAFEASGEIVSGETTITFTEELAPVTVPWVTNSGACTRFRDALLGQLPNVSGRGVFLTAYVSYKAVITTPLGTVTDVGHATVFLDDTQGHARDFGQVAGGLFAESFGD